ALMAISVMAIGAHRLGEMSLEEDLNLLHPRFMFGSEPRLAKRQDGTDCGPGQHSCKWSSAMLVNRLKDFDRNFWLTCSFSARFGSWRCCMLPQRPLLLCQQSRLGQVLRKWSAMR